MMNPYELHKTLLQNIVPSMRYKKGTDFGAWQKNAREKLSELLGMQQLEKADMQLKIEYETVTDEFREIRFCFQSEPGYTVPCHLLIPLENQKSYPVVICLQGHTTGMHISLGRAKYPADADFMGYGRDIAVRATKEGYCSLTLEQRCFGECGGTENGPSCFQPGMQALLLGRTLIGERVWDISRAIDVLASQFPVADLSRLTVLGGSGGGTAAFYAACLEERIQCAVPFCSLCTFEDSIGSLEHCCCNYIPSICRYFDMGDLAGLIAPRKLIAVAGNQDPIFPLEGFLAVMEEAKALYEAAGASHAFTYVIGDGGHRPYADATWKAIHEME